MGNKTLDKDSPQDMQWVFRRALERAEKYGIQGVTYFKTLGVVKNIIPAVASTNAAIAAVCVSEALKLLTFSAQTLHCYLMLMGVEGVYSPVFKYERKENCPVCCDEASAAPRQLSVPGTMTLSALLELLGDDPSLQLKKPSVVSEATTLYMQRPPQLEAALRKNLERPLQELFESGELLTLTDPALRDIALSLQVHFTS